MFTAGVHRRIYLLLLTLLGGCMVTSTWASNLVWVLLGVNWLFEGWARPEQGRRPTGWHERWQMLRHGRLLQAFLVLYALYLIGMLWTSDVGHGMEVLRVKLPLLVVPLVVLTSRPVTGRARRVILSAYVATVLVVSAIGVVRWLMLPDLPYREIVPYISHIRFSLNCCLVVFLLVEGGRRVLAAGNRLAFALSVAGILWLLAFLLLLRSYTGVAILALTTLAVALVYWRRWPVVAVWVVLVAAGATVVALEAKSYYRMVPQATEPLRLYTEGGRPYDHARDGIVENGNYINNYICAEELRAEWSRRSAVPFDSMGAEGYTVQPTLVRYLNALGLTKDSAGLSQLTDSQVREVENGVANPVYSGRNPLRKMVYVMLFEREYYVHTHAVRGFTMLQRFDLWQATLRVIADNRWVGVGTGDVDRELHAELRAMDSALADTQKRSHNQYLSLLAAFGVLGFTLVAWMFLRTLRSHSLGAAAGGMAPVLFAWLLIILVSFLTEDTLDTLAGILFCTYFLAFRPADRTGKRSI